MPSFSDSIVLFVLALMLFGPKRLPRLARELGKWIGEFRRASNEFKMQMDEELRLTEQADRQKEIAAMQAAAPIAPPIPDPEHPHLPPPLALETATPTTTETQPEDPLYAAVTATEPEPPPTPAPAYEIIDGVRRPIPIATSGDLSIMPPATGLPTPRGNALSGLLDAIPEAESPETAAHGN
jgi:sec-independent protein translocase protein TatB